MGGGKNDVDKDMTVGLRLYNYAEDLQVHNRELSLIGLAVICGKRPYRFWAGHSGAARFTPCG